MTIYTTPASQPLSAKLHIAICTLSIIIEVVENANGKFLLEEVGKMPYVDSMGELKMSIAVPIKDVEEQVDIVRLSRKLGISVGRLMLECLYQAHGAKLEEIRKERREMMDE